MSDPDKLRAVINATGFGTGQAYRDQLAAEAECLSALPDPIWMMPVRATKEAPRGDNTYLRRRFGTEVCCFGNSSEDGEDWYLVACSNGGPQGDDAIFPEDAKSDAIAVAAIVNAYRMGLLVRTDR
jgi:hypothetical protein